MEGTSWKTEKSTGKTGQKGSRGVGGSARTNFPSYDQQQHRQDFHRTRFTFGDQSRCTMTLKDPTLVAKVACHFLGDLRFMRGSEGSGKSPTGSPVLKSLEVAILVPVLVRTASSSSSCRSFCLLPSAMTAMQTNTSATARMLNILSLQ
eukprot:763989-Hanusia_phi.AAC.5